LEATALVGLELGRKEVPLLVDLASWADRSTGSAYQALESMEVSVGLVSGGMASVQLALEATASVGSTSGSTATRVKKAPVWADPPLILVVTADKCKSPKYVFFRPTTYALQKRFFEQFSYSLLLTLPCMYLYLQD
jgi:hypothetical protein